MLSMPWAVFRSLITGHKEALQKYAYLCKFLVQRTLTMFIIRACLPILVGERGRVKKEKKERMCMKQRPLLVLEGRWSRRCHGVLIPSSPAVRALGRQTSQPSNTGRPCPHLNTHVIPLKNSFTGI